MASQKILLIDQDPKNIRILRNNLMEAGFEVDASVTDAEALEKISQEAFSAILTEIAAPGIDGYRILEQSLKTTLNRDSTVIFLTQKSDVWNRVKAFKLGAKDYIIKPIHVREIIARVKMILARVNRHHEIKPRSHFMGTLADLGLVELIEAFGAERKTGVLSLYSENGASGRVFFREGAVVEAATGLHHNEEAVYKMISWRKGRFSMLFSPVETTDEIGVSNMGLLLQGAKRMEQREQVLKYLPSLEAVLVTTANFKKIIARKALAADLEYFVSLFDGERTLGRIIDESKYDEITSLQRIRKLYELGFLHTLRDFSSTASATEEEEEEASEQPVLHRVPPAPPPKREIPQPAPGSDADETAIPFETKWTAESVEQLLSPVEEDIEPEEPLAVEPLQESGVPHPSQPPVMEMEEFDLIAPDLSTLTGDTGLEKDLFYDLRHADEEGRDLFNESRDVDGGALFPNLQVLETRHPADALLHVNSEEPEEEEPPSPDFPEPAYAEPTPRKDAPSAPGLYEAVADDSEIHALEEETYLQERFKRAHGIILVLSNNSDLRRQMVSSLTAGQLLQKAAFMPQVSDLSLGTAEFKGGHLLNLVALSLRHEFAPIIDYFSKSLLGYILLIDGRRVDWGYYRYLLQVLNEKISTPSMIVFAYNDYLQHPQDEGSIRKKLHLRERDKLHFVHELSIETTRRIVFRLFDTGSNKPRTKNMSAAQTAKPSR